MNVFAVSLLLFAAASEGRLTPLTVYAGNWLFTPAPKAGTPPTSDHLTNHCHMDDAFYTCEQVVNGKPVAILIFVAGSKPGSFHTQAVQPDGSATGLGDLTIDGNHWTFSGRDETGKPGFRVENFFMDRNYIYFEQYKSGPTGAWVKTGEGDEVRLP